MGVKDQLSDFILASEKRHAFLVAEIQKSEQRTIDELADRIEPICTRVTELDANAKWTDRWLVALSAGWGALAGWLFTTHGGGGKP